MDVVYRTVALGVCISILEWIQELNECSSQIHTDQIDLTPCYLALAQHKVGPAVKPRH